MIGPPRSIIVKACLAPAGTRNCKSPVNTNTIVSPGHHHIPLPILPPAAHALRALQPPYSYKACSPNLRRMPPTNPASSFSTARRSYSPSSKTENSSARPGHDLLAFINASPTRKVPSQPQCFMTKFISISRRSIRQAASQGS